MYRLGLRQLANASRTSARAFSSRATSRVAAARRTGTTFAIAAPLLAYGLYQYSSAPIMNEEKNEIAEEEIDITPNLLDEKDLDGGDKKEETKAEIEGEVEGEDESSESGTGAFNPETGEINWDCPCLGGMAEGPCGEEFKAAFSCFVYSEVEPKGADCIEKFSHMQDCFRRYPEVYSEQLREEDPLESKPESENPSQETVEVVEAIVVEEAVPQTDAHEPSAEITKKD